MAALTEAILDALGMVLIVTGIYAIAVVMCWLDELRARWWQEIRRRRVRAYFRDPEYRRYIDEME